MGRKAIQLNGHGKQECPTMVNKACGAVPHGEGDVVFNRPQNFHLKNECAPSLLF
jgi:hypothetical protein